MWPVGVGWLKAWPKVLRRKFFAALAVVFGPMAGRRTGGGASSTLPISPSSPPRPGQTTPRCPPRRSRSATSWAPTPIAPTKPVAQPDTIWVDEAAVAEFPRRARRGRGRQL